MKFKKIALKGLLNFARTTDADRIMSNIREAGRQKQQQRDVSLERKNNNSKKEGLKLDHSVQRIRGKLFK